MAHSPHPVRAHFVIFPPSLVPQVMHAWIDGEQYGDLPIDDALRALLAQFRLPGEAQKIDRIMEKFAEVGCCKAMLFQVLVMHALHRGGLLFPKAQRCWQRLCLSHGREAAVVSLLALAPPTRPPQRYCADNPGRFRNADAAYMLAFAIIMLNTDAHNPHAERRLAAADFVSMNVAQGDAGERARWPARGASACCWGSLPAVLPAGPRCIAVARAPAVSCHMGHVFWLRINTPAPHIARCRASPARRGAGGNL